MDGADVETLLSLAKDDGLASDDDVAELEGDNFEADSGVVAEGELREAGGMLWVPDATELSALGEEAVEVDPEAVGLVTLETSVSS